ncbi:hypothetical protein NCCP2716_02790 [Sporosarcina sp. NCCP-2716]|uniref:hypothetical protein n=1 Tax=Sporosarcina sp. NCCP-2716 TaxID=2943679 RepID=UPI00203C22E8|nr:hypothetical protein [Sporosarcina sp. NCCP-2716]GKV67781.1 hypothetical protein NCCP2716_02790 [Sporosarcina sp. NCCP-2716]
MNYPTIGQSVPMNVLGAVQSGQKLPMREGQVFQGKIQQLFPGEMAEIQIGNQKLHAKLEVPLKAGDSYYFQVKATDPELQLKIVSGPYGQKETPGVKIDNLLETLQLPKTPEMRQLAESFMKIQLPLSKDTLLAGEALLKQVPAGQMAAALQSIAKLAALKLPVTPQLFSAMMGVETKGGLQDVLGKLEQALAADQDIPDVQKKEIQQIVQQVRQPLLETAGGKMLALTVKTALDSSVEPGVRFQTVQLLKSAGVLPAGTSLANLPETLAKLVTAGSSPQAGAVQTAAAETAQSAAPAGSSGAVQPAAAAADPVKQLLTVIRQADGDAKLPATAAAQAVRLVQQSDLPQPVKSGITDLLAAHTRNAEPASVLLGKVAAVLFGTPAADPTDSALPAPARPAAEAVQPAPAPASPPAAPTLLQALTGTGEGPGKLTELMRQALQSGSPDVRALAAAAEDSAAREITGAEVKQSIQTVLAKLGVNYEAGLAARQPDLEQIQHSLKPHLVALMQDGTVGTALREAAESAVSRLNGPLLQSAENGAQQQIIMQMPLQLHGRRIDATLEWNGRMKEDGKIDPDHARVLFYLDLEALKKTVVDMQVQNKVITLTIFNEDTRLESAGEMLQETLEAALEDGGYRLSAVRFRPFREDEAVQSVRTSAGSRTKGVDFRV